MVELCNLLCNKNRNRHRSKNDNDDKDQDYNNLDAIEGIIKEHLNI